MGGLITPRCHRRHGGAPVRRPLLWGVVGSLVMLVVLASVVSRAALAATEDEAPWQAVDAHNGSGEAAQGHPHGSVIGDADAQREDDGAPDLSSGTLMEEHAEVVVVQPAALETESTPEPLSQRAAVLDGEGTSSEWEGDTAVLTEAAATAEAAHEWSAPPSQQLPTSAAHEDQVEAVSGQEQQEQQEQQQHPHGAEADSSSPPPTHWEDHQPPSPAEGDTAEAYAPDAFTAPADATVAEMLSGTAAEEPVELRTPVHEEVRAGGSPAAQHGEAWAEAPSTAAVASSSSFAAGGEDNSPPPPSSEPLEMVHADVAPLDAGNAVEESSSSPVSVHVAVDAAEEWASRSTSPETSRQHPVAEAVPAAAHDAGDNSAHGTAGAAPAAPETESPPPTVVEELTTEAAEAVVDAETAAGGGIPAEPAAQTEEGHAESPQHAWTGSPTAAPASTTETSPPPASEPSADDDSLARRGEDGERHVRASEEGDKDVGDTAAKTDVLDADGASSATAATTTTDVGEESLRQAATAALEMTVGDGSRDGESDTRDTAALAHITVGTEEDETHVHPSSSSSTESDSDAELSDDATATTTSTTTSTTTTAAHGPYHQHHHQPPRRAATPSPLALSYLYYHALEALYVEENVSLFVQRARDAAPYGHARLNWLLGVLHAYGVGVPRSDRDALMYYSFAAMEAVPEAHMALGYRYRLGIGVAPSCESALAHYREAADAVAMTYDGTAAAPSGGTTTTPAGAKTISSGKGGRHTALSFLAYRDDAATSDVRRQRRLNLLLLKYNADAGKEDALLTLGYLYSKGDQQVVRDGRRAAAYFTAAASKGSARASGALGQLYMAGDPTIDPPLLPDMRRAYHHFRIGAVQNDALSLNGIGFLHAIGYLHNDTRHSAGTAVEDGGATDGAQQGVSPPPPATGPPDFAAAARYFHSSQCAEGRYNLGVLFLHGRGVPQSRLQARRLFEEAATQGSVLAQWQLANLLSDGHGVGSDITATECEQALALYQRTASFGSWQHRAADDRGRGTDGAAVNKARRRGRRDDVDADATADEAPLREERDGDAAGETDDSGGGSGGGDEGHRLEPPRSEAEYRALLDDILHRLHAMEESLVLSDEDEGPPVVSLASFVELLSLAETGDPTAPWLAVQYVDNYLEVDGGDDDEGGGRSAAPLLWPASPSPSPSTTTTVADDPRQEYVRGKAAASELLYHLLQRTVLHHTHTHAALGAAYLRLGNFFYYGESPRYGVDMARALGYYRIAGDHHHNPQALFNVGFMYQLGLHKAPRATSVDAGMSAQERMERPDVVQHYEHASGGAGGGDVALWKVHSHPPEYLRTSPSLYLAVKAAASAWNGASASPTARGVDVYLAWRYYTASLRHEARGSLAVRFALMMLNVQWSVRHFGVDAMLHELTTSVFSAQGRDGVVGRPPTVPADAAAGASVARAELDALVELRQTLAVMMQAWWKHLGESAVDAAKVLRQWWGWAEEAVLYGALSVIVLGLLLRHHVA
ncbi:Sel1 repeat [Novymonas esmeraldas]|uniref:Sel1 repeat n=1 Tax=Novymonas esmeraldas TaxID=1808958 RepID=A0AAW0EXC2_9TRYP